MRRIVAIFQAHTFAYVQLEKWWTLISAVVLVRLSFKCYLYLVMCPDFSSVTFLTPSRYYRLRFKMKLARLT